MKRFSKKLKELTESITFKEKHMAIILPFNKFIPKHKNCNTSNVVHNLPCFCGINYLWQTSMSLNIKGKENNKDLR